MDNEASYVCATCGEEIIVPIDLTLGPKQCYVEDCPVCCNSQVIRVELGDDDQPRAWSENE